MKDKPYLKTAINKIDQNLSEKINIEKFSSECFISPRQLYRDFYSYTGHSINEYIRKKRISNALSLLKHSNMTIADIAYSCGYSSQQALSKSIKTEIGLTPNQYRNSEYIYYFSVCTNKNINQITITNKTIPDMLGIKFYYHRLIGIENEAIIYLFKILPEYSGKLYGNNGKQIRTKFCYELYIDKTDENIKALKENKIDFFIKSWSQSLFAQITVNNNENDINNGWDFFYNHWLKNSMFELSDASYFEEYLINGKDIKKLHLLMSLRRKEAFLKIIFQNFDERLFLISTATGFNAEKSATEKLTSFISNYHPYFFTTQKLFYINKQNNGCTCGINLNHPVDLACNIEQLYIPSGIYAILEGPCYGNSDECEQMLTNWLNENGFKTDGMPFTVYDTTVGTHKNEIIVRTQVKIKMAEKYNIKK